MYMYRYVLWEHRRVNEYMGKWKRLHCGEKIVPVMLNRVPNLRLAPSTLHILAHSIIIGSIAWW